MAWPPLEPTHPPRPPALGSSGDTKSLGPLLVEIPALVQNKMVIAAATEAPRGHAAVCDVSSPDADPTYPTRLSIDGCCRRRLSSPLLPRGSGWRNRRSHG